MNLSRDGRSNISHIGAPTIATLTACAFASLLLWQASANAAVKSGEAGFKEYCVSCHADGGNMINAAKTLSLKDREINGVKTAKDIVKLMRKPGEGMTTFDKKMISDKDAKSIAEYIIKTFK